MSEKQETNEIQDNSGKKNNSEKNIVNNYDSEEENETTIKIEKVDTKKSDMDKDSFNADKDSFNADKDSFNADKNELKIMFEKIDCHDEKYYSNECNKFLLKKEFIERNNLAEHPTADPFLYPNLNDKESIHLLSKKLNRWSYQSSGSFSSSMITNFCERFSSFFSKLF